MLKCSEIVGALVVSLVVVALLEGYRKRKGLKTSSATPPLRESASNVQRQPEKTSGQWHPLDWKFPTVTPFTDFDLAGTPPPDFRPFHRYHRHMILTKPLDLNDWILLDNEFPRYHAMQTARFIERGPEICGYLPDARDAVRELCQELCEYLSRRYPTVYTVTRKPNTLGWNGEGEIATVSIPAFGDFYDLEKQDPLEVAGLIQPDDINILVERPDGNYYLSACMFAIGTGQKLSNRLDVDLSSLHTNGRVPHYDSQLRKPLERFLSKLKVEAPITRNTATFGIHDEIQWPTTTLGPEDDYDPSVRGPRPGSASYGKWKPPQPITDPEAVFLRQERQTLRRLPRTGAVVWMVHNYTRPVKEVVHEPGVPGKMATFLRSWDPELAKHKGAHLYLDCFLPYLDELHRAQVAAGLCPRDEVSAATGDA